MADKRLDGWKEISQYLDRDVRTCQRWEKELGLPIYRIDEESFRSKVFSYASEIDEWFDTILKSQKIEGKASRRTKWIVIGGVTAAVVVVFLVIDSFFVKKNGWVLPFSSPGPNPTEWEIKGKYLTFYDLKDNLLWSKRINNPDNFEDYYLDKDSDDEIPLQVKQWNRSRIDFSDVDQDNKNEVLCFLYHKDPKERCISLIDNDGRELWSHTVEFNQEYAGGRIVNDYLVYDLEYHDINSDGEEEILALWAHKRRFPSVFVIYNQTGEELLKYSHSGILQFFEVFTDENKQKTIFLAGTNNLLYGDAVLAVLDCQQLKSGLAPPYSIPPDLKEKEDEIGIYVPINAQLASQKYYVRFRKNEFSRFMTVKWANVFEVYAGENEINVQVNFGLRNECPIYYSFDSVFNLRYILPGTEMEREYMRLLDEEKIHTPIEEFLDQCKKDVLFWDRNGWAEKPVRGN